MSHFPFALIALLAALAGALLLGGCNPQSPLLTSIFVPLPPSTKVQHPPRHPPPPKKEVVVAVVKEEVFVPPPIDWNANYLLLPRDSKGAVDWMRALSENLITPKPGIDPAAEEAPTEEEEVEFVPKDEPSRAVTFRHATHTQWLTCKNCHSAIFKKRSDNLQFNHEDMDAGKYCGTCHFKVVVVQSGCKGCHMKKKS